ncbi:FAD binding domain-containing protein [Caldisericum exile]|uniref:Oxidoreductase FAD binding subunit n=1 Tax=Caldisericum exile (strain DSM 21853 / NBRC 104410 / AZM16c01) TaxID=511051 RepID=A0A7U6GEC9_CALEA|nr:xanthine dehydrogenase family protein subunit M [Caldisericum exile]BAL80844.1 oxidoreductase FAD binding subunit [Caldisericum exile AZM16c01]
MKTFEYFKPSTVDETLQLLKQFGDKAKLLAGGTDVAVMVDDGMLAPDYVIDLKGLDFLKGIEIRENNYLWIGALTTFSEIIHSDLVKKHFPVLFEASKTVASVGVRNRATLVGNICSAVPSADSAPTLLILDALVEIKGDSDKLVPIREFFTGPRKTVLQVSEIVTGIRIPLEVRKYGANYIKLGRYDGEDLAQVGVATFISEDLEYRIAFGAVAPTPVRAFEVEEFLKGKELSDSLIQEAIPIALKSISPISDVRASKEYRMHVSGVLFKRSLKASYERLHGSGPVYGTNLV